MRYLITARVKNGWRAALKRAIEDASLGEGSIAGGEYLHDMAHARQLADGRVKWVETRLSLYTVASSCIRAATMASSSS